MCVTAQEQCWYFPTLPSLLWVFVDLIVTDMSAGCNLVLFLETFQLPAEARREQPPIFLSSSATVAGGQRSPHTNDPQKYSIKKDQE